MPMKDVSKLFSSNIVDRSNTMALEKPNLRSPISMNTVGTIISDVAVNDSNSVPEVSRKKSVFSIEEKQDNPQESVGLVNSANLKDIVSECNSDDNMVQEESISYSPAPVSIEKPMRKSKRDLEQVSHSPAPRVSRDSTAFHESTISRDTPQCSPCSTNIKNPFFFNDILTGKDVQIEVDSIARKSSSDDNLLIDLSDYLTTTSHGTTKSCYSPPPPRVITPPLSNSLRKCNDDLLSFSPVERPTTKSTSPMIDASRILTG